MTLLNYKRSHLIAWATVALVITLLLSFFLAWQVKHTNQSDAEKRAAEQARELADLIIERVKIYAYGLRGARGHLMTLGENNLSRKQFFNYIQTRDLEKEFPGARGFGFIRRVSNEKEAEFLAAARADDAPDFTIRELAKNDDEHFVIQYIEPIDNNRQAVGLDIASEESRLHAAREAMRTGEVRLTAPITLVQATGYESQSFLILLPLYHSWTIPVTEEERMADTWGWSYAPLLMKDVLVRLPIDPALYHIELRDITDGMNKIFFLNDKDNSITASLYPQKIAIDIFGRRWELFFSISPQFIHSLNQTNPTHVFLITFLIGVLISFLTLAVGLNFINKQKNLQKKAERAEVFEQQVKERTAELNAVNRKLTIATDIAHLGIWVWDGKHKSLEWNDQMYQIYEQPISLRNTGLSYTHWIERLHPEDSEYAQSILRTASHQGGITEARFRLLLPSGKISYVDAIVSIQLNNDGSLQKVIGVNRDITEQITQERSLIEAKEQADAASKAKSEFLANMSHEIRTPMNAVIGMLELVQNTELTERQNDYVYKAKSAAKSLLELLNDILEFSKIEAGKLYLDPHPFTLKTLIHNLSPLIALNKKDSDLEVIIDIAPDLPPAYLGDELRLRQILINLISNAIKFTQKGYVKISINCLEKNTQIARLRFQVKDTGIGISQLQQARLFSAFVQAESSTTRRYGGTGLGLAICKRLTQLMNSDLQMESSLGHGSRFWFDIDMPMVDAETIVSPNQEIVSLQDIEKMLQGLRLLVVEDNELNRQVAYELLSHAGAEVELVTGGHEAIEKITTSRPFDLVLMDVQMPDIDGLETTRLIRAKEQYKDLPILAMTANIAQADKEECLAAGMNGHLAKPIDIVKVVSGILMAVGRSMPTNSFIQTKNSEPVAIEKKAVEKNTVVVEELNVILKRFGNNQALFDRMLARFRPEVLRLLAKVAETVAAQNSKEACIALHSLKGITATMGAKTLAAIVAECEQACKKAGGSEIIALVDQTQQQILLEIFEESERMLVLMSAKSTVSPAPLIENKNIAPSAKKGMEKLNTVLISQLKTIRPLLVEGRLDALRKTETIYLQLPDHRQLAELWRQVNALDYVAALKILDAIVERQQANNQDKQETIE
jgi:signal transduction histidine kinase/CHASE1-domain containing sensor protein/DNA-binding response OmpR family regulator